MAKLFPKKPKTKKKAIKKSNNTGILLGSLLVLLLIGGTIGGIMFYRNKNQTKIGVYPVQTLNCADWWEEDSDIYGTLTTDYVQEVLLDGSKEVEKIFVKEGDIVKEGDTLLKYNMEEEELNLKLQELQIKSAKSKIAAMEEELKKLKGKHPSKKDLYKNSNGSLGLDDGSSDNDLDAFHDLLSGRSMGMLLKEEGSNPETEENSGSNTEAGGEKEEDHSKPVQDATTEKTVEEEEKSTSGKEETSTETGGGSTTEVDVDGTTEAPESTEEPEPDPQPEEKDTPKSKTIESLDDRAIHASGDGKTEEKPYVFLMIKNSVNGESRGIKKSLINELMKKGIFAVFKEYESLEAYNAGEEPSDTIKVAPYSIFTENLNQVGTITIPELKYLHIVIKELKIKPKVKSVTTGTSYSFTSSMKVEKDSKNEVELADILAAHTKWAVSGNKSKNTIISNGALWVADNEKAKSLIISCSAGGMTETMKVSVKKKKTTNGGGNGGGGGGGGGGYIGGEDDDNFTADELKEAISSKEEEITQAKTDLAEAKINYKEAKKEVEKSTVKAKLSGKITTAYTLDALPAIDTPVIVLRADDGIYVKTQIGEMDLETVKVGGTIVCKSFETDEKYEAIVKEVSDYPVSGDGSGMNYNANPNSSYYPVVAYIENAEGLSPGQSVAITYSSKSMGESSGESIYLQKAYIRSDANGSYVLKQGEKKRLEKQYIQTGKTLNGQYIQVLKGIKNSDYIAFPYGKKVKEGAKTEISENDENIIY